MSEFAPPVVYDAGALVAAEAGDRQLWVQHNVAVNEQRDLVVPTPVLTQVWRGGPRQALLSKMLRSCRIEPPGEETARMAGLLLGRNGSRDAVDALVVATALACRASRILTSDVKDLQALCNVAGVSITPRIRHI